MDQREARALGAVLKASINKVPFIAGVPSQNAFRSHKWVVNKKIISPVVRVVTDAESPALLVGIVEWNPVKKPADWYVIGISEAALGTTEIELHHVDSSGTDLVWRYRPNKHDGRNEERAAVFAGKYPGGEARVIIPAGPESVPLFLEELQERIADRRKADVLTPLKGQVRGGPEPTDEIEAGFLEGQERERYIVHRYRERRLRQAKIAEVLKRTGQLACEVSGCGFDFKTTYGKLGDRFAHVHHRIPFGSFKGVRETKLDELAIVCANCHAMIHVGGQNRGLNELKSHRPAGNR
jgi:hypothetical protein